jgi:hypothetical protein
MRTVEAASMPSAHVVDGRRRRLRWRAAIVAVVLVALAPFVVSRFTASGSDRTYARSHLGFGAPHYFPTVADDTFYNTVGADGAILTTANDSTGVAHSCTSRGSDITILEMRGPNPGRLAVSTVNCMVGYGPRGGGKSPDGCSWKTGGITRIGTAIYLTVARQLKQCSRGHEANGLQPSYDASIIKSVDGGLTWTNPWGRTDSAGAAPLWNPTLHRYDAMFPGRTFSAPFFIQYGPGNTQTVDGADKYLYVVSTDGYVYNGSELYLARVPLDKIQTRSAWQFYDGAPGGQPTWTTSIAGATSVLQARRALSQPAIQYIPALHKYVLFTSKFTRARATFPSPAQTPYTELSAYVSPKPWGPWTKVFAHSGQRSLWCASTPCKLTRQPGSTSIGLGAPGDWLGLYDPALVQKFVFTRPLSQQALLSSGDWKNAGHYRGEQLNRLHILPVDLTTVLGDDR